jgi:SM-20-related protein
VSSMRPLAREVGFLYEGHQLRGSHDPALRAILAAVNAPETLERVRTLTGFGDITHADGQATRYRGGHFLTRHRDDLSGQARRVAYVLSLTARWHPDWGGLLQFFEDDGTPRDAWVPGWNVLSLFDVRHVHSVTYVAPFAGGPRLSVTGWFRAGPVPAP